MKAFAQFDELLGIVYRDWFESALDNGTNPATPTHMHNTLDVANVLELQISLETRQALALQKKDIEQRMDRESEFIKAEMIRLGVDSVEVGDWVPTLSVKERKTLDKVELVQQGVTTAQIERATKVSTYVQLDVRAKKVAG
jgi:hypothetical protein